MQCLRSPELDLLIQRARVGLSDAQRCDRPGLNLKVCVNLRRAEVRRREGKQNAAINQNPAGTGGARVLDQHCCCCCN
ncbi:unnamed protein product [Boreogadus saida]